MTVVREKDWKVTEAGKFLFKEDCERQFIPNRWNLFKMLLKGKFRCIIPHVYKEEVKITNEWFPLQTLSHPRNGKVLYVHVSTITGRVIRFKEKVIIKGEKITLKWFSH